MPQSLAQLYVHLVFSTKGRTRGIPRGVHPDLRAYTGGVLRELDSPMLCAGAEADHIHILYRQSKNTALAKTVEKVKTATSKWLKTQDAVSRSFHWQAGYAAFSVSASKLRDVQRYIENQAEHHRTLAFQEELRQFLRKYSVEYDERYVWD